jgi:hypothetical protein
VNAYIPVRVTDAPRSDGSVLVYLPDGTALTVNNQHLVRLDSTGTRAPGRSLGAVGGG